jgi:hypothetical protein
MGLHLLGTLAKIVVSASLLTLNDALDLRGHLTAGSRAIRIVASAPLLTLNDGLYHPGHLTAGSRAMRSSMPRLEGFRVRPCTDTQ